MALVVAQAERLLKKQGFSEAFEDSSVNQQCLLARICFQLSLCCTKERSCDG